MAMFEVCGTLSVLFCVIATSLSCSPEGYVYRNEIQRVHDAQAVVYGRVLRTFTDENFAFMGDEVYTAEMQVYCVIKGDIHEPIINVTEAGAVPGLCHVTYIRAGEDYVVTLNVDGDTYRPDESQYTPDDMDKISMACDLTPTYPDGVTNETYPDKQCPVMAGPDDCTPYTPPERPEHVPEPPKEPKGHVSETEPPMQPKEPITEPEPPTEPKAPITEPTTPQESATESGPPGPQEPITEPEPTNGPEPPTTTMATPPPPMKMDPPVMKIDPPVMSEGRPGRPPYTEVKNDAEKDDEDETTRGTPVVGAVEDRENGAEGLQLSTVTMLSAACVFLLQI